FFFQAEDGIRDLIVTGVQTCALPISLREGQAWLGSTRISGPDTSLTLSGTYDLRSAAAGVGTLSGRFDARLLRLLIPDLEAQGRSEERRVGNEWRAWGARGE